MRVALLRGDSLNRYEMQSYEPLLSEWELVAFTSWDNTFDLNGMRIPVRRLHAYTEFLRILPARLRRYGDYAVRHVLEIHMPFVQLVRQLKGFDIVHTADAHYFYSYQAIQAKKRYDNKVVVTQWENIPFLFERRRGARRRKQETLKHADAFVAITERAKEALILEGVPAGKIRVIPMGIDLFRFRPAARDAALAAALGIHSSDKVILYAGRLVRSKGLFELFYAFSRLLCDLNGSGDAVKLVCVGSGNALALKPMLLRLGLAERVIFAGNFSYDEMPKIHNLADVFVLPSVPTYRWQEQFGMVLVESMACGKPIISTMSGSIPEVVGDAGVLVQPYDHLALYQALRKLLLDSSSRARLGQKGRARAEAHFDCRQVAMRLSEVYRSLFA